MNNRDRRILQKMYEETNIIPQLLAGADLEVFGTDEKIRRAVCMTLINIGELVKALSEEMRATNRHIPWRAIAGLRDVAAHHYQTIRIEDIWQTIVTDIPLLNTQIMELLEQ